MTSMETSVPGTPAQQPGPAWGAVDPANPAKLPYVTPELAGIGGVMRQRDEDFLVEEIPLYDPCGEGEHIYLLLEKRGLSTQQLVQIVAKHFGVPTRAIGYAGMKDKHAITRQVMSVHVPGKKLADFPSLQHEKVQVMWADMHTNKLRLGHLRGNRFSIRVRGVQATAVVAANKVMKVLADRGVPNFFGEQRFGLRLNNHELGRLDLLGDWRGMLQELLGPDPDFPHINSNARKLFAEGNFDAAHRAFPFMQQSERMAVRVLARGRSAKQAVFAVNRVDRQFWVSAYQSALFNRLVAERMGEPGGLSALREGDLAYRHANGAVFRVTPEELAKPELMERVAKFELSPSGPLWGSRMTRAEGETGRREEVALLESGVALEALDRAARHFSCLSGSRRPMRIPLIDPEIEGGVDEHGSYVRCAFELPSGSFATVVMREIVKGANRESAIAIREEQELAEE